MFSPDDEPTEVLKLCREYRNRIQSATSANRTSSSSGFQQRLRFDDSSMTRCTPPDERYQGRSVSKRSSCMSSAGAQKLPRLDSFFEPENNPSNATGGTAKKFCPSADDFESMKIELDRTKMALFKKEAECSEAESSARKYQDVISKMEFEMRKERAGMEDKLQAFRHEKRQLTDEVFDLKNKVTDLSNRIKWENEEKTVDKNRTLESKNNLEKRCSTLLTENCGLQEELAQVKSELKAYKGEESEKVHSLRQELLRLTSELDESKEQRALAEQRAAAARQSQLETETIKLELAKARLEVKRLRDLEELNREATLQRKAMHAQLAKYPKLLEENENLKRRNQLLIETSENIDILKEQVESLQHDLELARNQVAEGQKAQSDLSSANKKIQQWTGAALKLFSSQERRSLGENSVGVDLFLQKIALIQRDLLLKAEEISSLKIEISDSSKKLTQCENEIEVLKKKLKLEYETSAHSTVQIKKLERTLMLVSKERDSFMNILDSYENELTVTSKQLDGDRCSALNKIIDSHKAVIEELEKQLQAANSGSSFGRSSADASKDVERLKSEISELKTKLTKTEDERDQLKYEFQRRELRGDVNPMTTKVLHFRNNPVDQARENLKETVSRLQQEAEALRARIKLMEEGQSKDLTLLVGQKVGQGTSEEEVNELREKLKSAETAKHRYIEAFRDTSQKFREALLLITGYRVDGLENQRYRLTPTYAESSNDNLVFEVSNEGNVRLMETPFTSQLKDLIDLHLKRQNSIPVFCAAVILDLFSRRTFDASSTYEDDDQEEEDVGSNAGGNDEDPICIDSD